MKTFTSMQIQNIANGLGRHTPEYEALNEFALQLSSREEYAAVNMLGGPAKMFDAMADRIRGGENFHDVLADYDLVTARGQENRRIPIGFMSPESLYRLKTGGNDSRGTVPVHSEKSGVSSVPVYCDFSKAEAEMTFLMCYVEVAKEIQKAVAKFPTWPTDPLHALAILGEEFGELTKAALQSVYEPHKVSAHELRTEAVQTAAMALRFLQSLDVYRFTPSDQHTQSADAPW